MSAGEASLLQAVVVVPAAVRVHLHAVLLPHLPRVEGLVRLPVGPVDVAHGRPIHPGPADWVQRWKTQEGYVMLCETVRDGSVVPGEIFFFVGKKGFSFSSGILASDWLEGFSFRSVFRLVLFEGVYG